MVHLLATCTSAKGEHQTGVCGNAEETSSHVFQHCMEHRDSRSPVWTETSIIHVEYMEEIVKQLRKMENPNFHRIQ